MGGLLAGLAALAAPMTARILIALGFSVVTLTGVAFAFDSVKSQIVSNIGGMPAAMTQLMGIGGGWIAVGAILGAMTFVVTLWGLTSTVRILGVA